MNDVLLLPASPGLPAPLYDEADIRRSLGHELDKGRPYQRCGAVRDLRADRGGARLFADVQGTRRRPYRVSAEIASGPRVRLSGMCSCPVAVNCKHVAAVFLEALHHPPAETAGADPLAGSLGGWLERLRRLSAKPAPNPERVVFIVDLPPHPGRPFTLDLRIARVLKRGGYGADRACPAGLETATGRYVQPEDRLIARLLRPSPIGPLLLPDDPDRLHLAMRRIVMTGRCHWRDIAGPVLTLGPSRSARLGWRLDEDGRQYPAIVELERGPSVLSCAAPWYVEPDTGRAGPLEFGLAPALVAAFLAAPAIDLLQAAALGGVFDRDLCDLGLPRPRGDIVEEIRRAPPRPVLRLANRGRVSRVIGRRRAASRTASTSPSSAFSTADG